MAKKTSKDKIKGMNEQDLVKELGSIRDNLQAIGFKAGTTRPKNVKEVAAMKKQIAQILTQLNQIKK